MQRSQMEKTTTPRGLCAGDAWRVLHLLAEDWESFDVKAGEWAYPQTSASVYAPRRIPADIVTW